MIQTGVGGQMPGISVESGEPAKYKCNLDILKAKLDIVYWKIHFNFCILQFAFSNIPINITTGSSIHNMDIYLYLRWMLHNVHI